MRVWVACKAPREASREKMKGAMVRGGRSGSEAGDWTPTFGEADGDDDMLSSGQHAEESVEG
jgi:hypothetical protein